MATTPILADRRLAPDLSILLHPDVVPVNDYPASFYITDTALGSGGVR